MPGGVLERGEGYFMTHHGHGTDRRGVPDLQGAAFGTASALNRLSLSEDALHRMEIVRSAGMQLDRFGQVVPQVGAAVERKISTDLLDIRHRGFEELHAGKHVIYVPGSYDLVHAGHASYIM